MAKNRNPYREGSSYHAVLEDIRKAGIKGISRQDLIAKGHPVADVTVVTSPRKKGEVRDGADCRGNMSAQGHIHYMIVIGSGPKRFRNAWRNPEMDKRTRTEKVVQKKKATKSKAKAKAKRKSKATA